MSGIFEYNPGCISQGEMRPGGHCLSPVNDYYTIFGTELGHLSTHLFISLAIGLILIAALFLLRKKRVIKNSFYWIIIIPTIIIILLFFLLAYYFPVYVTY